VHRSNAASSSEFSVSRIEFEKCNGKLFRVLLIKRYLWNIESMLRTCGEDEIGIAGRQDACRLRSSGFGT
jgi:hypothetical protein